MALIRLPPDGGRCADTPRFGLQPLKVNNATATNTTVKVPRPTTVAMNQRSCITRCRIADSNVSSTDHS